MPPEKGNNLFTRTSDWILEKLVDASVLIYRIFQRKKPMNNPQQPGNGQKGPGGAGQVRQGKITMAPTSFDVKFADFAQIVLTPTHGTIKFGTHQAGTDDFVVHTQIAMPPQALAGFADGLKQQIDRIKEQQKKQSESAPEQP
ncbi:MAG: hypothetical protein ABIG42_00115 [bacterium]